LYWANPRVYLNTIVDTDDRSEFDQLLNERVYSLPNLFLIQYIVHLFIPEPASSFTVNTDLKTLAQEFLALDHGETDANIFTDNFSDITKRYNIRSNSNVNYYLASLSQLIETLDNIETKPIYRIINAFFPNIGNRYVVTNASGLARAIGYLQETSYRVSMLVTVEWKDSKEKPWCYSVKTDKLNTC
jgi:hypothetical protein